MSYNTTNLDGLGCLQSLLRWDAGFSLLEKLLDEVSDVLAGDWKLFDAAVYHIAIHLGCMYLYMCA